MSRRDQLALDLRLHPAFERDAFIEAPSNAIALAKIENWPRWPGGKFLLLGPEGSGKSHLAAVWANLAGADIASAQAVDAKTGSGPVVIEDVDRIAGDGTAEEALFHLYNRTSAAGVPVLFTSRSAPAHAGFDLPDLRSRLSSVDAASVDLPDDTLLAAVLRKHISERQLEVADRVIDYILSRMDRSHAAADAIVAGLNRASFAGRRAVTVHLARDVIASFGDLSQNRDGVRPEEPDDER